MLRISTLASSPARAPRNGQRTRLDAMPCASRLAARTAPEGPMDFAWRWGYMAVCLLTMASAAAVASGEAASAELKFATRAVASPVLVPDICTADSRRAEYDPATQQIFPGRPVHSPSNSSSKETP